MAAVAAASVCFGSGRAPGFFRMFLSGVPGGGAVSLNTLLPELSIQSHCAVAEPLASATTENSARARQKGVEEKQLDMKISLTRGPIPAPFHPAFG